jgi:hypothetical protein
MTAMDRIRGHIKYLKSERAGMDDMPMAHGCLLPKASQGKMNSSIDNDVLSPLVNDPENYSHRCLWESLVEQLL